MPLTLIGDVCGNAVRVDADVMARTNGTVTFLGTGNVLEIGAGFIAHGLLATLGEGAQLHVGTDCVAGQLEIHVPRGGRIAIGQGSAFNGLVRLLAHETGRITIGRDCLFGADVDVTVSDMHSILDAETGVRLNPARDVTIGDRVWLGYRAFVGKGSEIGSGAVVGAQSVVTGVVAPQTLVAGQPARLLREGIAWSAALV
ncbi:acyltransferase [Methylobacterium haplocladii]|uniref:Transferase n=1 Tax=Methylobacterium haplocladii TaxID=1176176 RepID=A0A512IQG9_9HYPH|nr:acyltransferase [Methylobacterium haplocladii]GEO99947.1 hypothetical protein MHA02_23350 [Methylobacterium haplocladii]GJD86216.1 2,3,4,5-tetrahydropyridine-2,6-dicarboxylate N-acetyltransferase [Methylobacterium haplocladii]GLS59661.1 hypothetical protein GCM10007887_23300 [Methylobacterium haplocladii]